MSIKGKNELIKLMFEQVQNSDKALNTDFLEKYNFSEKQWDCFIKLAQDFELNADGASILLDEIMAGRIHVPC